MMNSRDKILAFNLTVFTRCMKIREAAWSTEELRQKLPLDLIIFHLVEVFQEIDCLEVCDRAARIRLPRIRRIVDELIILLDYEPASASATLADLLEVLQVYAWICSDCDRHDEAAGLKEGWHLSRRLLSRTWPEAEFEPWEDHPPAQM